MEPDRGRTRQPGALWILLAAMLVVGTGVGIWLWWAGGGRPPEENLVEQKPVREADGELAPETIEQFYVGLAALDIEENQRAAEIYESLSKEIPREPAVWANLAIAQLRLNQVDEAGVALAKAAELAPNSSAIRFLRAVVAERSGEFARAIELLRGDSQPDVRALYMQAELVGRAGEERSDRERLELLNQILEREPGNLVVLFEAARLSAKLKDRIALTRYLDVVSEERESWSPQQLQMYESAQQALEAGEFLEAARYVAFLQNLSKQSAKYQSSVAALGLTGGSIGDPVRQFLAFPEPEVIVAEADRNLTFETETIEGENEAVRPDLFLATPLSGERGSTLLSLSGNVLQVSATAALPFPRSEPGGPIDRHAVLPVDLNYDFRQDLVLVGPSGTAVYLQAEGGQFTPFVPNEKEREIFERPGEAAWAIDFEADGDLDLLIARGEGTSELIRNNGDMTFTTLSALDHLPVPRELEWMDFDGDGDVDLAMLDRQGRVLVSWNERAGEYAEVRPVGAENAVAIAGGDIDRDGRFDVASLDDAGAIRRHSYDGSTGEWSSTSLAVWEDAPDLHEATVRQDARLFLGDLDNNGAIDVVASAGANSAIWLGAATSSFVRLKEAPPMLVSSVVDVDGDGQLDLAGLSAGRAQVAAARGTTNYGWHAIQPRANPTADKRINPFGLGGKIEIRAGRLLEAAPIVAPRVHFGLGTHASAPVARIVWPNGTVQAEFGLASGEMAVATQRLKGSCPWLFAAGDDGIRFLKDFIWRSPLGLKINSQETAGVSQTEDWVKIPGEFLTPQDDGRYELRITAELWETHFFDHVSLMVVDHPREVEVFVDERFIAARSPALRVIATSPTQKLAAVLNESGADVSEKVAAVDGRYVDSFPLGTYQGIADEHWVEFTLPSRVPVDHQVLLIGQGWIYPTDSSLNVAISQGAAPRPHGLILETVDAEGNWTVVSGDLGFPAGKNKTVVIPLPSDLLRAGLRRFRLRTNLEVYWDFLGWAGEAPAAELETTREQAAVALLKHRGFSQVSPLDRRKPDIPDYSRLIGTGQRWRDLEGYYTRFGDVRELLQEIDDRYVIMNAGDEFVLEFPAPGAPPRGWTRDFVLIGDGWVKDGDFNTRHSRTVHPLPSHASPDYGGPARPFFEDPVYLKQRDDWLHFHTRYVTPRRFELGMMGGRR